MATEGAPGPPLLVSEDGRFEAHADAFDARTQRVRILAVQGEAGPTQLTWSDVVRLWAGDGDFGLFYSGVLAASPYAAFFWECPATSSQHAEALFEHVTVDNARGFAPADPYDFQEHLRRARGRSATSFINLGGDATLVAPCGEEGGAQQERYGHLAAFVRGAPAEQQRGLWAELGATLSRVLAERGPARPTWLSTEGSGVPWVHVRLDSRPKYYHTSAYRRPPPAPGGEL